MCLPPPGCPSVAAPSTAPRASRTRPRTTPPGSSTHSPSQNGRSPSRTARRRDEAYPEARAAKTRSRVPGTSSASNESRPFASLRPRRRAPPRWNSSTPERGLRSGSRKRACTRESRAGSSPALAAGRERAPTAASRPAPVPAARSRAPRSAPSPARESRAARRPGADPGGASNRMLGPALSRSRASRPGSGSSCPTSPRGFGDPADGIIRGVQGSQLRQ